ncbi:ParA family protein [Maribacter sp.]|uniref:ParA family protein n=1 Tax=Maribacter sp. TaxID=1897614 RepID=UPI0025BFEA68|nr:ParA family protein [Maribacter sp.]|tara:strand:+ start:4180 stop:4941 length:762 start_codon:yes stop_codon:yes gene_type:complete
MVTIAIINQKGGVAKTTTSVNLAAQASLRYKTLIVDCDKQANLTNTFDQLDAETNIKNAFLGEPFEVVNVRKNIDLIPSTPKLIGIERIIQEEIRRESILDGFLSPLAKDYDYCFLDCPPDIGLITVNALATADYVIIPLKADSYSLQGVDAMLPFIQEVRDKINPKLTILGFVLTQYNERLNISKQIMEEIHSNGWDVALFDSMIRINTSLADSQFHKKTIFEYDKNSNGAKDYMQLGKEVLTKIKKIENEK